MIVTLDDNHKAIYENDKVSFSLKNNPDIDTEAIVKYCSKYAGFYLELFTDKNIPYKLFNFKSLIQITLVYEII